MAAAILIASVWASGWQRFTWGARIGTFGCALAVLSVGLVQNLTWRRRSGTGGPGDDRGGLASTKAGRIGLTMWLSVIAVAVIWDVLGLLTPPNRHHLTLSAMELAYRPLHALLFACWLALGWVLASQPMRRQGT